MNAKRDIPPDFSDRIKRLRGRLQLTQVGMAELMGVSFASVNRWENGQSRPSVLAWQWIAAAETMGAEALKNGRAEAPREQELLRAQAVTPTAAPPLDFLANPEAVGIVAEGERLAYGHL